MAIVCAVMALGLLVASICAREESEMIRVFWLVAALLNGAAAVSMLATNYDYAWRLLPSEELSEFSHRR